MTVGGSSAAAKSPGVIPARAALSSAAACGPSPLANRTRACTNGVSGLSGSDARKRAISARASAYCWLAMSASTMARWARPVAGCAVLHARADSSPASAGAGHGGGERRAVQQRLAPWVVAEGEGIRGDQRQSRRRPARGVQHGLHVLIRQRVVGRQREGPPEGAERLGPLHVRPALGIVIPGVSQAVPGVRVARIPGQELFIDVAGRPRSAPAGRSDTP